MSILRVFTTLTIVFNILLGGLGLFGYFWRPIFRDGSTNAPYVLLRLYSWLTPRGTAVILGLWLLFWLFALIGRFVSKDGGKTFGPLIGVLRIGLIIAVLASIPSFLVSHEHISEESYNESNYNLMKETSFGQTSLLVVRCSDSSQFSCKMEERVNVNLPPDPTPIPIQPTRVVEIEGHEVILIPNYIKTPTPPVAFGIEADSGDLGVRIGNQWGIIATVQVPTPIGTPNPEAGE
ncbi:MAG: hypothetical protein AB8G95_24435 [Anaerolineae bacterium]